MGTPEQAALQAYGMSLDEAIRLTDAHTLTVQGWLASRSPNAEKFEGLGVRASSTGYKVQLLNLALGCGFPEQVTEAEISDEIEAVKNFFKQRNVPWYWWMNRNPLPKNIGAILEQNGLKYIAPPLPAMVAPNKQDVRLFPDYPSNIKVWRAASIHDLQMASKIRRIAFGFPEGEALAYFEAMESDWLSDESPARLYLAGLTESEPVSIGAVIHALGIPGIYVMATLPEYHRKGFGKSILTRLLAEAARSDGKIVALTASKSGAGLYAQFGLKQVFGFDFCSIKKTDLKFYF